MSTLDWLVLVLTQLLIVVYGVWKSKQQQGIDAYLRSRSMNWFTIGLSIMATQASAITFLSAPGLAYNEGMRFVQFYFGLPIAMVILSIAAVPMYYRLNVYTAYEFLEQRFDLRTRSLAALLFLTQRGLAAGFTIFAPSLILSSLLGWNIYWTNLVVGLIVILYTVTGGTEAVARTQKTQMAIILGGMAIAGYLVVAMLPEQVGFSEALHLAGKMGRLEAIDFTFDLNDRYTIWSGLIGGTFLMLSYFGTDQSQVARYLGGQTIAQSRMGLIFNGLVKIPMQFAILFVGAMVFVFYLFAQPPVFFNQVVLNQARQGMYADSLAVTEQEFNQLHAKRKQAALELAAAAKINDETAVRSSQAEMLRLQQNMDAQIEEAKGWIRKTNADADTNDTNYIFLRYVFDYLPAGLIGLIISVIFSASMSSTSSELQALAGTTVVDIYRRMLKTDADEAHYVKVSRWSTLLWGLYAIAFAMFANRLGTLIEAVNILGSLVYGTILGIFVVAFFIKSIGAKAVFLGALVSEAIILLLFKFSDLPFLWYNVIGCLAVVGFGLIIEYLFLRKRPA
jgi:solute:Na+ symporter, SSS family